MNFNHYFTNAEIATLIQQWEVEYPQLFTSQTIGNSFEGRPLWLLTITHQKTGADSEKPAVWIDGNIHATEIAGTTAALHTAYTLLSGYGKDSRITRLLDQCTYYIVPRVNPDGAFLAMAEKPRFLRSGVRPYPYDEKEEGLHLEDVDGDGKVLQMRFPDPNGDWKVSTLDSRLMEKRAPDDYGGDYYRMLPEGMLEDYDGYLIKIARPPEGLDFNRNFPFEWRTEGEQEGAGPYPASEPEIRNMVDFITSHTNINIAITFHTFSRVILRPYSTKADDELETEDLWVFKKIGERGEQLTGYRCLSTFHDFKYHPKEVTTGAFDDWMYDHLGVFAYTIELWDLPDEAGIKKRKLIEWWREHPHEEDVQILKWVDENLEQGAYFDWRPFDHPQLGQVEIGGWHNMFTWRNPPVTHLANETAKQVPFMLALGDMLPKLSLNELAVNQLEVGVYHVNLVVENSGFLPTYTSKQGKNRKAVRPVRVELELPETAQISSGKRRVELGHLEGRASDLSVTSYGANSPTSNRARLEWVIRTPPGTEITISVLSERAGSMRKKVTLD